MCQVWKKKVSINAFYFHVFLLTRTYFMFNFIEKLRQKPESSKTLIAFSFSFLFAGTIFLVWLTVVLPDIRQDQEIKDKVAKIEPSPFSTFFGNVANSFSALNDLASPKTGTTKLPIKNTALPWILFQWTYTLF